MTELPAALARVPLVSNLPDNHRGRVVAAGHEGHLERGEIVFHEGDRTEAVFAVLEGQVKLVRYSPKGKEMLLHLVHPGQSFAEAALFGEGTYPATAEAVESTVLWVWPRARLEELLRADPDLGLAMIASVSLWTRRLAAKLELLTQRRVEERLAVYLLGRVGGRDLAPGDAIPLAEPRNLIAAQLGTAPEVLSRTFRHLEEDGLVAAEPHQVRILQPLKLRALAEWLE